MQLLAHTHFLDLVDFFFDMSKTFDKVWHERLIFKLRSMGISDALLYLIGIFFENGFQRTVLNGHTSEWLPIKVSVPKGSILGPLFFLICINDLSVDILSTVNLSVDDTSPFSIIYDAKKIAYELNKDLQKTAEWTYQWKMSFNPVLNRQAQEVISSRKMTKSSRP